MAGVVRMVWGKEPLEFSSAVWDLGLGSCFAVNHGMPWDLHAVAFMSHLECGLDLCGKCFCNKSVGKVLGQNSGCKVFDVHQATKLLASLTTLQGQHVKRFPTPQQSLAAPIQAPCNVIVITVREASDHSCFAASLRSQALASLNRRPDQGASL
eukprot:359712-Chlamydomonas_euryale.AAC.3